MKIVSDRSLCVGAGQCVMFSPNLFAQDDDDGLVVVLVADIDASAVEDAKNAVRACPSGAIKLVDDNGEEIF
ncbi:MAG: ferredoxin [Rhodobiaceae bacterium]|nr:ferredoxin [Rhodobiaceae bacterium]MCC0056629.1 ferredoxin [Rhodobiaceae bacterium]